MKKIILPFLSKSLSSKLMGLSFFALTFIAQIAFAQSWQVMVVFAGADMDSAYQAEIDRNMLELARLQVDADFQLQIVREFNDKIVVYNPGRTTQLQDWSPLFYKTPVEGIQVPGQMKTWPLNGRIFQNTKSLRQMTQDFYQGNSLRMLIYYGHGEGSRGLRGLKASQLKSFFNQLVSSRSRQTPLDILWMDSCYMGNLEVAYELRHLTKYYVASQEAEFAAGSPLQNLDLVEGQNPEAAAQELATKFVESYSTLKSGSQSQFIESSSATVSVIQTDLLNALINDIKNDQTQLQQAYQINQNLWSRRMKSIQMEHSSLVDLGGLLKWTPSATRQRLELDSRRDFKTAPRVVITNPGKAQSFVFAFNGWKKGFKGDNVLYPERLKPESYFTFKGGQEFPVRKINKKLVLSPFAVGLDQFDWMFINASGKLSGQPLAAARLQDFYVRTAQNKTNPVRFFATTYGIGATAEKYSGLNVSNPFVPQFDMDYANLEFVRSTGWGQ